MKTPHLRIALFVAALPACTDDRVVDRETAADDTATSSDPDAARADAIIATARLRDVQRARAECIRSDALRDLSRMADARVAAEACFRLGLLTGDPTATAVGALTLAWFISSFDAEFAEAARLIDIAQAAAPAGEPATLLAARAREARASLLFSRGRYADSVSEYSRSISTRRTLVHLGLLW